MSFNGYEYEDWLLTQWGLWNSNCLPRNGSAPRGDGLSCEISDDTALLVNAAMVKLHYSDQKTLKLYYLCKSEDVSETEVSAPLRRFACAYNGWAANDEPAAVISKPAPEKPKVRISLMERNVIAMKKQQRILSRMKPRRPVIHRLATTG